MLILLYSNCNLVCDLWEEQKQASEPESDLQDTVDWGRKGFVDFHAGKTQLISFDCPNNCSAIGGTMDGSLLEEKSSFKMLGLFFSSKLDWGSHIVSIAKTVQRKLEPQFLRLNQLYEVCFL